MNKRPGVGETESAKATDVNDTPDKPRIEVEDPVRNRERLWFAFEIVPEVIIPALGGVKH